MENSEIIRIIVHEFPYALYGSLLVGSLCAFIGVYVVAKRVVFLGAVLTQVSVLGLALTFLPFVAMTHTIGSLVATILAALALSKLLTGKKIPKDAVLGSVFVFAIAARILVMQKTPKVEVAEIESLLRGDILFVTPDLFFQMIGVFVVAILLHLIFFKEFMYISFDPETARTQGYKSGWWEMLFYLIAAIVISVATHMVGDVFVFGYMVIPPVAAMLVARRVSSIFAISFLIGLVGPAIGLFLAFKFDFPSSPTIVAVACVALILAWGVSLVRS